MQADHMPPDANLLLHEVTQGAAQFLAAYEYERLVSCSCSVKAGRGAGKRGDDKRTGEAWAGRIMYPSQELGFCPDSEKSVRKGFYAGKGHDSEIICSGWWETGQGKARDWEAVESTKPK